MTDIIDYRNLKPHPLAKLFPKYRPEEFQALVDDIKNRGEALVQQELAKGEEASIAEAVRGCGLLNPIILYEGKILDGVNRYAACKTLGLLDSFTSALFRDYDADEFGTSAADYVVSLNLNRRHLTDDQRAVIAAKLATMPHGGARRIKPPIGGLKIADAALQKVR